MCMSATTICVCLNWSMIIFLFYFRSDRMSQLLDERDLGVLTAVMSLFVALVSNNIDAYWNCLPKCVKILERLAKNQDIPQEYTYYGIPSPWLQVWSTSNYLLLLVFKFQLSTCIVDCLVSKFILILGLEWGWDYSFGYCIYLSIYFNLFCTSHFIVSPMHS